MGFAVEKGLYWDFSGLTFFDLNLAFSGQPFPQIFWPDQPSGFEAILGPGFGLTRPGLIWFWAFKPVFQRAKKEADRVLGLKRDVVGLLMASLFRLKQAPSPKKTPPA